MCQKKLAIVVALGLTSLIGCRSVWIHPEWEEGKYEADLTDLAETQQQLLGVVEVAREHFAREEQILFELAPESLGDEMLRDLGAKWAARRGVMI